MGAIPGVLSFGGYGQAAIGRSQLGTPTSEVSPTFYTSSPADGKHNVARDIWIEFYTYFYSSVPAMYGPDPQTIAVEVSEDGGQIYVDAETAPYELTIRPYDGQRYWCKILKLTGQWAANAEIVIRFTGEDEHGNPAVKAVPVVWS